MMDFHVRLVCCRRCGLVYQEPLQDEDKLDAYYSGMFREEKCRPRQFIEEQFKPRVAFAAQFIDMATKRSVLEVGCADGTVLEGFRSGGFEVFGIEPSRENVEQCNRKGIEAFEGMYEDFPVDQKGFDFVCSYYVLEHTRSPVRFLSFCNEALIPEGILCLEFPDVGAYKLEPSAGDMLFFFEHQYHFTRSTVGLLLTRCGFKLLEFSDGVSNDFGMHLAARKVSAPIPAADLPIQEGMHQSMMKEVSEYQAYADREMRAFRKKVGRLLEGAAKQSRIVLFGAGSYAHMILQLPEVGPDLIECVVDNNSSRWGSDIYGVPIRSPDAVAPEADLIVVASSYHHEIREQLLKMGVSDDRIVIL